MQRRSIWSVLIYTLVLWGVTSGLSLYGMWRDPWIGEQGSGEHPLIFLGIPMWFALIGASAAGVPLPAAALLGAVLQFTVCLPFGYLARRLIMLANSRVRRRHGSMGSPCILFIGIMLTFAPAQPASGEQREAVDFRTRRAPAVIHIFEAPRLVQILGPDGQQRQRIQAVVEPWKTDYLQKAAELENLPAGDVRRRAWSPERDRNVGATIEAVLTPPQREMLSRMVLVWNFTPVSFSNALRDDYAGPLKLSPGQQEALFHLNVQWVLHALEDVDDEMLRRHRSLINPAWQFKRTRDAAWRKILSAEQAELWKQIELRQAFRSDLLTVLKPYTQAWMQTIDTGQLPLILVPYFDSPTAALAWTPEQEQQIRKIAGDLEAEVARIQAIVDPADRRAAWASIGPRLAQSRADVLELMTDSQRAAWRNMAGNDSADATDADRD